jgi:hypothetical protein
MSSNENNGVALRELAEETAPRWMPGSLKKAYAATVTAGLYIGNLPFVGTFYASQGAAKPGRQP